jgi:hypothetical protein
MAGRGIRKTESFLAQAATARQRVPSVLEAIALAEGVGFEPTGRVNDRRFSRPLL